MDKSIQSPTIPSTRRHNFTALMRRLSNAGFKKEFVLSAILPDWWEETCAQDPNLLGDVEMRVARFLGLPLSTVRDPDSGLAPSAYSGAQLRRVRAVERDRLAPAIHSAMQIAAAVVRCLGDAVPTPMMIPAGGLLWRERIQRAGRAVTLKDILADLWLRGIPVVPLDLLPAPSFQGMACITEGRPVILLGHKHDEPGSVAFLVVHETGHIATGDCAPDRPVVDEDEDILDNDDLERRADQYATDVLVGPVSIEEIDETQFKEIARKAGFLERETGADAGAIISAWAARTGDYATATLAWKALYRSSGARRQARQFFDVYVDLEGATESDRNLLRCVCLAPARHHET